MPARRSQPFRPPSPCRPAGRRAARRGRRTGRAAFEIGGRGSAIDWPLRQIFRLPAAWPFPGVSPSGASSFMSRMAMVAVSRSLSSRPAASRPFGSSSSSADRLLDARRNGRSPSGPAGDDVMRRWSQIAADRRDQVAAECGPGIMRQLSPAHRPRTAAAPAPAGPARRRWWWRSVPPPARPRSCLASTSASCRPTTLRLSGQYSMRKAR